MTYVKKTAKVLVLLGSLVALVMLKVLQPIVKFQLCIVGFHRYGHLALEPEVFLAEQELSKSRLNAQNCVVNLWSFGPTSMQSNRYLARKWNDVLIVIPSWLASGLHDAGSLIARLKLEEPKLSITGSQNGLDKTAAHLSFSVDEIAEGKRQLHEIGIDPNRPHVCLIVRDGGHYKSKGEIESPGYDLLNFDINNFASAAKELLSHGLQVVRMGSGSEQPFSSAPKGVIDYALMNKRSEFLDVYLAATCEFAVSTQTGPDAVCMLFRRPVLYVDVTRYGQFFFGSKLATWSPVRLLKNGEVLSVSEIVNSEIAWFKDPTLFAQGGVSQQKSSESEIRDLVFSFLNHRELQPADLCGVQKLVSAGLGEKGRLQFGEVTAKLLPNADQILGEWVRK
jgi:putative glycosyltransferase (TIGR04372 family)